MVFYNDCLNTIRLDTPTDAAQCACAGMRCLYNSHPQSIQVLAWELQNELRTINERSWRTAKYKYREGDAGDSCLWGPWHICKDYIIILVCNVPDGFKCMYAKNS